jgi:membrane protease YdiL (CAAX protease family)
MQRQRSLGEEVLIVLSLSLLASAVYAIIGIILSPPKPGQVVYAAPQAPAFAMQVAGFVFGLAPVWLVLYLVRLDGEGPSEIGLALDRPGRDIGAGVLLAAIVGGAGILLYFAARALGVNRLVIPVPPMGHWWTIPTLVMSALGAALLEEVVVVGYLITRLRQMGWAPYAALAASALLRGSYHLYQGWGGFAGNLAMGLIFGFIFLRTRRLLPLIVAHFSMDLGAGVLYMLFHKALGI